MQDDNTYITTVRRPTYISFQIISDFQDFSFQYKLTFHAISTYTEL